MHRTLVFFCFTLAGISAIPLTSVENKDLLIVEECAREYGLNGTPSIKNNTNSIFACTVACAYKKMGVMKEDGTIDLKKTESIFGTSKENDEERKVFYTVHNACKNGRVGCSLAKCMFTELFKLLDKVAHSNDTDYTMDTSLMFNFDKQ